MSKSTNQIIIILLGLVLVYVIGINYNEVKKFFILREGKENNTTKEQLKELDSKISEQKSKILTAKELGDDTTKVTTEDFLTNERKGELKKLMGLKIDKFLLETDYDAKIESIKKLSLTYSKQLNSLEPNDIVISLCFGLQLFKGLGIDYPGILDNKLNDTSSAIDSTSNVVSNVASNAYNLFGQ
tara:strand:+ start:343 stop:897 length:555 start_codon:yes stop_codon:yes gene_type:complete